MAKANELTESGAIRWALWTLLWCAAMAASAAISLYWLRSGVVDATAERLIGVFALGALMGFPAALTLLSLVPDRWRNSQRFAAGFLAFGAATLGFTAFLVALDFLNYYSEWHDDHLSKRRVFETVMTILSACYQFLVLGLRLFLPLGFFALIAASWAFALRRL